MRIRRDNLLQILLVLVALLGYWPVIGFENTLKWDIIDQYFPWRMFIVECLRSGVFPLWNPYEQLGTPIFADPQSGYWYAPVWLSALFGEYTLRSVHLEFFMHVSIGGLGMFRLLRLSEVKSEYAFFLSLAYVFSGFFIGNAQHLTYVVSGCWMPFVLWSFWRLLTDRGYRSVLRFSLFTWLLVTGGYPAFSIILFYVLALLWCSRIWFLRKRIPELKALLLKSVLTGLMLLVLLSGLIFTLWQGRGYFNRTEGLDYAAAAFGPFSPQSSLSFLFPLAAVRDPEFFNTDISMSSAYLGWFSWAGFILFVFGKKRRTDWLLLSSGVFFLLASFGKYTPLHRLLFDYVPMMDWFRFPSVYRLFAMIGIVLAAGIAFSRISNARSLMMVQSVFLLASAVVLLFAPGLAGIPWPSLNGCEDFFRQIPVGQALALQAGILIPLLLAGLAGLSLRIALPVRLVLIAGIGLLELLAFSRMNMPVTVVSDYGLRQTQAALDSARVKGFPIPDMQPVAMNQDSGAFPAPFWKNLNLFRKQPAWDGYNNFQLRGYVRFFDQEELRKSQLRKPWVSYADTVIVYSDSIIPVPGEGKNKAYLNKRFGWNSSGGICHPGNRVVVTGFEPGRIDMDATVESDSALLVVMQQAYPGWEVRADGLPVETVTADYLFQAAWIGKGRCRLTWEYVNSPVRYLSILGFSAGLLGWLGLFLPYLKNRRRYMSEHHKVEADS